MDDIRETRETDVPSDANQRIVVDAPRQTKPVRRGGSFGGGVLLGALAAAAAAAIFAYSQGSFQNAGADADRAAVQARHQVGAAAQGAGNALETAGDNAKQAGDNASRNSGN